MRERRILPVKEHRCDLDITRRELALEFIDPPSDIIWPCRARGCQYEAVWPDGLGNIRQSSNNIVTKSRRIGLHFANDEHTVGYEHEIEISYRPAVERLPQLLRRDHKCHFTCMLVSL